MKRLEDMTPEEKIGQMLLFGWPADDAQGPSPSEAYLGAYKQAPAFNVTAYLRRMLQEWKIGGVILMGRNVESPEQVAGLTNEIQALAETPVFVTTDQEGGHVSRMKKPFTVMPGNMPLGATRDEALAYAAAKAVGEELRAIGVNVNLAPDADVNNNPGNPIIGVRSYSADPALVGRMVAAQVRGYQDAGTISCAKHFPGHGDTAVDSHLGLAHLQHGMERLMRVEIPPFKAAIAAGVSFIMTAHIIFEALDPNRPATLSSRVVNGRLRQVLGFDGVVITDCMEMRGIISHYGIGEAAIMAIEAGVDILAACHTPSRQETIRTALLGAMATGRLSQERINTSVRRILACKERFGLEERRTVDVGKVMQVVGSSKHRAIEQEIARKSITLVNDKASRIPLPAGETVIVGPPEAARALADEISSARAARPTDTDGGSGADTGRPGNVSYVGIGPEFTDEEMAAVNEQTENADAIVVLTKHKEPWTIVPQDEAAQAAMVKRLVTEDRPVVVVALRNPYDLRHFPEAPTYLTTYGYTAASLAALAEVLIGAVPAQGQLPVGIPREVEVPPPAVTVPEGDTRAWGF